MKAILAVNNLGFIGIDKSMLWHNRNDFKHFREKTQGSRVLVGFNTNLTLPPLPGREVIIDPYGRMIKSIDTIDWCIGGKKTYEKYASYFTELHISHIDNNHIGNITFPDLTNLNPNCKIFNYYF